mmetsp:Transcript_17196/g.35290  ORF Transcript_17196/g.35290 Transcript_17196/m.35290 type:complete len:256 (-) Transcript_17196:103-870(-)
MPKVSKVGKFRAKAAASPAAVPKRTVVAPSPGKDKATDAAETNESNSIVTPPSTHGAAATCSDAAKPAKHALSRGQRKRQAKREQYLRREKMVLSTLRLEQEKEQKGRIDGLDSIREALMESVAGKKTGGKDGSVKEASKEEEKLSDSIETNKAKKNLAGKELTHMGLVLQHPAFKSDPFGAIREHLKNTLASQAEVQQKESETRRREEEIKEAERKRQKKEKLKAAKVGTKHKKRQTATQQKKIQGKRGRRSRR